MNAVHTKHTARSCYACCSQNRAAFSIFCFYDVTINGRIGKTGGLKIAQNILLHPKGKGLADGAAAFKSITARFQPALHTQLALTGHRSKNSSPAGFPFKLMNGASIR